MAGLGYGLLGFNQALQRQLEQNRLNEQSEAANRLRALQEEEVRRRLGDQAALPGALGALAGATPESRVLAPAVPGTPAALAHPPVEGEDPEAAALIPRVPGTPGQPEETGTFTTMKGLTAQLGPEQMALLMKTPEGREALRQRGISSETDIKQAGELARARRDMRALFDAGNDLMKQGDIIGGKLKHAAAMERLGEAAPDEQRRMQATLQAQKLRDEAAQLSGDKEELTKANRDMVTIWDAMEEFRSSGFSDDARATLIEALAKTESKTGSARAAQMLQGLATREVGDPDTGAFWREVAKNMAGGNTLEGATATTFKTAPEVSTRALPKLIQSEKTAGLISRAVGGGTAGLDLKGDDWKVAMAAARAARRAKGLSGEPDVNDVIAAYKNINPSKDPEQKDNQKAIQNLKDLLRQTDAAIAKEQAFLAKRGFLQDQETQDARRRINQARRDRKYIQEQLGGLGVKASAVEPSVQDRNARMRQLQQQAVIDAMKARGYKEPGQLTPEDKQAINAKVSRKLYEEGFPIE